MQYCTDKLRNCQITKSHNSSRGYILIHAHVVHDAAYDGGARDIAGNHPADPARPRRRNDSSGQPSICVPSRSITKTLAAIRRASKNSKTPTSNVFLRKHYKDPLSTDAQSKSDKDFKLIRPGDPVLNMLGLGGGRTLVRPDSRARQDSTGNKDCWGSKGRGRLPSQAASRCPR